MKLLAYSLILPLALGEQLVIPAVQSDIAQQLAKFSRYTEYEGPTGTASAIVASSSAAAAPKVMVNAVAAPAAVNAAATTPYPYWYETITHQGKAAFNTNTTYAVFRNVKTYGAKGYVANSTSHNIN